MKDLPRAAAQELEVGLSAQDHAQGVDVDISCIPVVVCAGLLWGPENGRFISQMKLTFLVGMDAASEPDILLSRNQHQHSENVTD